MHLSGLLGILLLVGLVAGCDGAGHDTSYTEPVATQTLSSGAVNVEQIDSGQYGDIVGTRRVLRDSSAYADFWAALHADRDSLPERPSVDFATEVVVAVVMGERPTGGYTVTVDDALADPQGGGIQVRFTETMPGDECEVTQAMTSPYVLATVAAQSEDITFAGSEETRTC